MLVMLTFEPIWRPLALVLDEMQRARVTGKV